MISRIKNQKIVIDGFPLEYYRDIEVSRDAPEYFYISDMEISIDRWSKSSLKLTIRGIDNIEITCTPDFYEITEDTIYIYGVLRKMFPAIFADRELLFWQEDYLRDQNKYNQRARYFRNDPYFDTPEAKLFHSGYKHGKKRGEETARKEYTKETRNDRKTTYKR